MLNNLETWILSALQTIFDQFGWLGVAGIMLFENATGLTPSEITLGMAGWFLVSRHDLPFSFIFLGGLYAAIGSLLGASLTYWVARIGGRPVVEKIARWCRVPVEHINQTEATLQRWGPGLVFFGRMVPGVRTLVSIPAGLARMNFAHYLGATFTGAYIWCTLLIGVGFWLGEEWAHIGALVKQYGLPAAGLMVLLAALFWWFHKAGKKRLAEFLMRGRAVQEVE